MVSIYFRGNLEFIRQDIVKKTQAYRLFRYTRRLNSIGLTSSHGLAFIIFFVLRCLFFGYGAGLDSMYDVVIAQANMIFEISIVYKVLL